MRFGIFLVAVSGLASSLAKLDESYLSLSASIGGSTGSSGLPIAIAANETDISNASNSSTGSQLITSGIEQVEISEVGIDRERESGVDSISKSSKQGSSHSYHHANTGKELTSSTLDRLSFPAASSVKASSATSPKIEELQVQPEITTQYVTPVQSLKRSKKSIASSTSSSSGLSIGLSSKEKQEPGVHSMSKTSKQDSSRSSQSSNRSSTARELLTSNTLDKLSFSAASSAKPSSTADPKLKESEIQPEITSQSVNSGRSLRGSKQSVATSTSSFSRHTSGSISKESEASVRSSNRSQSNHHISTTSSGITSSLPKKDTITLRIHEHHSDGTVTHYKTYLRGVIKPETGVAGTS